MPVIRTPEERFSKLPDFPFAPHYIKVNGLRIHYVDEGKERPYSVCMASPHGHFYTVK